LKHVHSTPLWQMVVQAMLRPPFDYILSYDPLLQLTIYPDPLFAIYPYRNHQRRSTRER
jgi:hypothetical protein